MTKIYDVLIVGGGLAGAAAAIGLAEAGRDVLLLEKESSAHDKVCGEFLSGEAMTALRNLGVDPVCLGASPIRRVRFARHRIHAEAGLPFPACGLSRRILDEALLRRAQAAGVEVSRGKRVQMLTRCGETGWEARLASGETKRARKAVLATGKHDLLGWPRGAGKQDDLIGFKMHWKLADRAYRQLDDAVELVVFPGGYCGLQSIECGVANLALLIQGSKLREIGGSWQRLLEHMLGSSQHLAERLAGAQPQWRTPQAIARIPYGYLDRSRDGIWRIGDQAAVIPSFSGSGMSIALRSARLAVESISGNHSVEMYRERLRATVRMQVSLATMVSRALVSRPVSGVLRHAASWVPGSLPAIAAATRIIH